jgi:hypothetical protein
MAETNVLKHMSVQLSGNLNTGTALMPIIVCGTAKSGYGGFTLIAAQFCAGTTTGAGTAYTLELVHGGYRGTALGGTVAAAIGGTASTFASDAVYAFTVLTTSSLNRFAEGDSLSVRKVASGVNMAVSGVLTISYMDGR